MEKRLKYAIIGTGAIGGFYGAMLSKAGEEVHFLLHRDYEFVKANGLHIHSELYGSLHLKEVNAYRTTNEMPACDFILVCLKSTQNEHLLSTLLPPLLHSGSVVVLIQNRLGVEEDVARLLPGISLAGGIALIASSKTGPGQIHHLEHGRLDIGNYNLSHTEQLEMMAAALKRAGIPAGVTNDLHHLRWRKLVWNIAFNGLSVLLHSTTDKLVKDTHTFALCKEIMREVIGGANACGVPLAESFADKMMQFTKEMRPYAPSMKLDFDHHRPLETRYIYQIPVARAKAAGYYMSKTDMMANLLLFLEKRSRQA